jgi:branched-chain amino acid transport system permease protein
MRDKPRGGNRSSPKFGIDLADEVTFFYVVLGIFAISLLIMYTLVRSPFGRSLVGIRERELRMKMGCSGTGGIRKNWHR